MSFTIFRGAMLVAGLLFLCSAQAGVVLNTTRVIYQGQDKEVSFGVHNSGTGEILVQSWLEPYDPSAPGPQAGLHNLPFIVTPALAPLPGGARQLLRIIHAGSGLPLDRESVLWLNVQEIPQTAAQNTLQIAIRQRIKLFYRPAALTGDPALAAQQLQWQRVGKDGLEVFNPGPYHVSMLRIGVQQAGLSLASHESRMLAPRERWRLPLKPRAGAQALQLQFVSINDFGGQQAYQASVPDTGSVQASEAATR